MVSNLGAAIISLRVPDNKGKLQDVVLGYEDIGDYSKDEFYLGTVVGRYANRISGDTVLVEGEQYKLFTKEGGYHLHGGKVGFNKKYFTAVPFSNKHESGIIFSYTSAHLEEGFPGELRLEVIYTLTNNNAWAVEYKAVSDKTTLLNLTQHAYFNLSGNPAINTDEHELQLHADYFLPVNEMQVPTGELRSVSGTVFDFRSFKKMGKDIQSGEEQLILSQGYDHSFVLEKQHTNQLKFAATVCEASSGIKMEVFTTEPAVHFYAGNFLSGIKGKNNIVYTQRAGFCLETQHFPDAPKHAHFPSTLLEAGEVFYSKTIFKFSVD